MARLRLTLLFLLTTGLHLATSYFDDGIEASLTKSVCTDALVYSPDSPLVKRCCSGRIAVEDNEGACVETLQEDAKTDGTIAMHNLANCVYVKRKFTKGDENLNFKRIKAYLRKLDDPRERALHLKIYKKCSAQSKEILKDLKAETKPGDLPMGMKRPFFFLVFVCYTIYPQKESCPYYLWDSMACDAYKQKCKELEKE